MMMDGNRIACVAFARRIPLNHVFLRRRLLRLMLVGNVSALMHVIMAVDRSIGVLVRMGMDNVRFLGQVAQGLLGQATQELLVPPAALVQRAALVAALLKLLFFAHRLNPRYKSTRKSGAPKNEVIAPIGRMIGLMTMRARRSLPSMITDPKTSDAGKR